MSLRLITNCLFCLLLITSAFGQAVADNDLVPIKVGDVYGFADKAGKIVIAPAYKGVSKFSEGLALVFNCNPNEMCKAGFIDPNGRIVIPISFDDASSFSEGLARVGFGEYGMHNTGDHKTGFIDKTGKLVIPATYRDAASFHEGLAVVTDGRLYGFIDKTGKAVIALKYEVARSFSEGMAIVFANGKYGYIDKSGGFAISPRFSYASDFLSESACVKLGGETADPTGYQLPLFIGERSEYALIDKTGKIIKGPSSDDCMQAKWTGRPWLG